MSEETSARKTILVVDDHPGAADMLARWLARNGFSCRSALSADEAFKLVRAERPALIILDYHMPEKSGLDMFAEMRADVELADVPVIFFSADFDFDAAKKALAMGAKDWLVKGVHGPDHILKVVSLNFG